MNLILISSLTGTLLASGLDLCACHSIEDIPEARLLNNGRSNKCNIVSAKIPNFPNLSYHPLSVSDLEQCSRGFLRLASISYGSKLTGIGYDSLYFSIITVLLDIVTKRNHCFWRSGEPVFGGQEAPIYKHGKGGHWPPDGSWIFRDRYPKPGY